MTPKSGVWRLVAKLGNSGAVLRRDFRKRVSAASGRRSGVEAVFSHGFKSPSLWLLLADGVLAAFFRHLRKRIRAACDWRFLVR
jgi:hypothetical protein